MNRRSFLAGVTGVAPFLFASSGRGASASANDRIAIGFVGAGTRGGDGLIKDFLPHDDCQIVAICDTFRDRREQRAGEVDQFYTKKYGKGTYKSASPIADFRDLLARKDIDAVCIATPDHWHVPILLAAVRAGKDVYVEKPLSPSFREDLLARKTIHETGRVFQYGTQQRGGPHVRFACDLVRRGGIGKIRAVEVVAPSGTPGGSTAAMPVPEGFDYEMWQGPAPERPYNDDRCKNHGHYHTYDYSIGFLGGWGAHPLDVLDWGLPEAMVPCECEGTGLIPTEGLYNTVMNWDVRFSYPNGMTMTFRAGTDSTKFSGADGWVRIGRFALEAEPKSLIEAFTGRVGSYAMGANHSQNFLDAVRKRVAPESPIDSAVRSDLISHLANIAVRTGRKIRWDAAKEQIVGDAEAAAMLDRPMRGRWII